MMVVINWLGKGKNGQRDNAKDRDQELHFW